jgi:hypothetical protein
MPQQPEVAVAFTIRHKFVWTLASLQPARSRRAVLYGRRLSARGRARSTFLADKTNVVRLGALPLPQQRSTWR